MKKYLLLLIVFPIACYAQTIECQLMRQKILSSAATQVEDRNQSGSTEIYENMLRDRLAMHEKIKEKRQSQIIDSMLSAMAKPGFMRGDISESRSKLIKEHEKEDLEFQESIGKLRLEIAKRKDAAAMQSSNNAWDKQRLDEEISRYKILCEK